MPYEVIFLIPVVVGIVWMAREFFLYEKEMKERIDDPNWQFTVIEKEGLQYIVPNVKGEVK